MSHLHQMYATYFLLGAICGVIALGVVLEILLNVRARRRRKPKKTLQVSRLEVAGAVRDRLDYRRN